MRAHVNRKFATSSAGRGVSSAPREALRTGVHPRDLYALRDAGVIEQISRGVYRLADLPPLAEPDLFTVAARVPKAVICARVGASLSTDSPRRSRMK